MEIYIDNRKKRIISELAKKGLSRKDRQQLKAQLRDLKVEKVEG